MHMASSLMASSLPRSYHAATYHMAKEKGALRQRVVDLYQPP